MRITFLLNRTRTFRWERQKVNRHVLEIRRSSAEGRAQSFVRDVLRVKKCVKRKLDRK